MEPDKDPRLNNDHGDRSDSVEDELRQMYDKAFAMRNTDPRAAKALADEVYAKAAEANSPYWQGISRYAAGFSHYILSEYESAIREFERGDAIAREHGLPGLAVKFRNGYGVILGRIGRYDEAIEQFAAGLKEAREMDLKRTMGNFLVNLGELSLRMGNIAQALSFETEAVGLIPEMADGDTFAVDAYFNLAEVQAKNGQIDDAETSYRQSLAAALQVGNRHSEVEARIHLGSMLADRGHEAEALTTIEEALRLSRSNDFPLQEVAALLACGRIEQKLGRLAEATAHTQAAVDVAEGRKMGDFLPSALEALSAVEAADNRYEAAYLALLRSVQEAHTWSCSESARKLAELAAGYRLEKAKRDAEVERSRREGLESANERLRMVTRIGRRLTQSLEPKDILMRMWEELSSSIDLMCLAIGIYCADSKIIEFPGWVDTGVLQNASSVFLNDDSSLAALCVREKRTLYYATKDEARSALGGNSLISLGKRPVTAETILYLPLFRENDIVGVMTVQSAENHAYSRDIVEMLEAVASFAAIAVENASIMIRLNEVNHIISGEKERVEQAALASSWLAEHDSLTGLFNRRFLERILDENIRLAALNDSNIAIFFIDLDDFKDVNDTYGHDAGDRVLVTVGARLLSAFREGDYVARVGGDEFIVVAPGLKEAQNIASIADKLIASFDEPLELSGGAVRVGMTIGVAIFPDHGRCSQEIINRADEAMYSVKRSSKGSWRLWSGD